MSMDPLDIHDRVTLSPAGATARLSLHPTERGTADPASPSFDQVLKDSLLSVDRLKKEADEAIQRLTVNGGVSIHKTMIAMEKADLSFRLMMQIRNKIVEAYQEVMRMQV
ncbi:MAG: flagellar hook-basal body complex protein FliE [Nitrospinae bacterium]|nr:flagellar hook-basal body complex protein FliE [Nitrospinota bacterium]